MKKWLVPLLVVLLEICLPVKNSLASDSQFVVNYDISYKVNLDGITTVTQNFDLTNLTSEFFASEYLISLQNSNISNLRAFDRSGPLILTSLNQQIHIKFRNPVVGIGKTMHFSLAYESSDIAKKEGRIWEVFIPQPVNLGEDNYMIELYVPDSFGGPIYQKPAPKEGRNFWRKKEISSSGIAIAYSPYPGVPAYQAYDFTLKYQLNNSKLYPIYTYIALPPDTNYQKIFLNHMIPPPIDVTLDEDGNWLAKYFLSARSNLEVAADGSAAVFSQGVLPNPLPLKNRSDLGADKYWETDNPKIVEVSKGNNTPEQIYNFVVTKLFYDKNRGKGNPKRLGAAAVLMSPNSAICLEFTDLFVSLARANGIAARELDGFGLTQNESRQPLSLSKDTLHAWPEYFDRAKNSWVMVDPTWGKTTLGTDYFHLLDFDHLVFVIHGKNSQFPYPAGTYKNSTESKNVTVTPVEKNLDLKTAGQFKLSAEFPKSLDAFTGATGKILIQNLGPTSQRGLTVIVNSSQFEVDNLDFKTGPLPPFARREKEIAFKARNPWVRANGIISLETEGTIQTYRIAIVPIYQSKVILLLGGLLVIGILSITTQITRRLLLQKRKK